MVTSFLKTTVKRALFRTELGTKLFYFLRPSRAEVEYTAWMRKNTPTQQQLEAMRIESDAFARAPKISVLLPVFDPKIEWLNDAINSVRKQAYQNWELCIADDASQNPEVRKTLERHAVEDSRIKVVFRPRNGHISESSNSAFELVTGDYVALLDHDDMLSPDALYYVAREINAHPDVEMMYSNEDKINHQGQRCDPTFKPGWSPDYFLSFMYIGHLSVYKRELISKVGGFRKGFEGSQDYDLALRITERASKVRQIPQILYHWRMHPESVASNIHAKPYAFTSGHAALSEALQRRGEEGTTIEPTELPGISRVGRKNADPARVTFIVSKETGDVSRDEIERLLPQTPSHIELLVLSDGLSQRDLPIEGRVVSRSNLKSRENAWLAALTYSTSEHVLLIDAGARPTTPDWLSELLSHIKRPGIAAVTPKLVDVDRRLIVSAGYSLNGTRVAHNFFGLPISHTGYAARLVCHYNVSAMSSRCMMLQKSALRRAGAFSHEFQSRTASEVDLCFRLARQGDRLVVATHAAVSLDSRRLDRVVDIADFPEDLAYLEQAYGIRSFEDPFFPRGLNRSTLEFSLAQGG